MKAKTLLGILGTSLWLCTASFAAGTADTAPEAKEPADLLTGPGEPRSLTGGPDAYGYTYFDQGSGCTYNFIDITTTGTVVGNGDDVVFTVPIGGPPFNFYGLTYTTIRMSTNGFLSVLPAAASSLTNTCPLPSTAGQGGMIAVMWDDLDMDPASTPPGNMYHQYFAACPRLRDGGLPTAGCDVYQWKGQHFPGSAGATTVNFEAILYDGGSEIVTAIAMTGGEGGSGSTTAIQDHTELIGLNYACNAAASLVDGITSVCWLSPVLGGCCFPLNPPFNCAINQEADCIDIGGTYLGDDLPCTDALGVGVCPVGCPEAPVCPDPAGSAGSPVSGPPMGLQAPHAGIHASRVR